LIKTSDKTECFTRHWSRRNHWMGYRHIVNTNVS